MELTTQWKLYKQVIPFTSNTLPIKHDFFNCYPYYSRSLPQIYGLTHYQGAVETLIVWEGLETVRHSLVNGKTQETRVLHAKPNERPVIPPNESPEDWEVVESVPLLDYLAENYTKFGCELELIQAATAEGSQFVSGFGGVGGLLRYKLDLGLNDLELEANSDDDDESQFW